MRRRRAHLSLFLAFIAVVAGLLLWSTSLSPGDDPLYNRVQTGMTSDEVTDVFGYSPSGRIEEAGIQVWMRNQGDEEIWVRFDGSGRANWKMHRYPHSLSNQLRYYWAKVRSLF